ncbi:MAG: hypothetical protein QOH62_1419 [Solirubrobacteraceae bacterium]|jgi:hypothetical protein|nr:hypothetical protein [Solirubrobacteraceae bacterium]
MSEEPRQSLFEPTLEDTEAELRPIARERPEDPAGTKPRHDPSALLPESHEPLLRQRANADAGLDPIDDDDDAPIPPTVVPPHSARFQFVYGILIGVAVAALVAAAIVFTHGDRKQTVALSTWSTWQPTRGSGDPIQQIVDHVAPEYRLPSGRQIVAVTGGPSQVQGVPLVVALVSDPAKGGAMSILENKNVVLYRMCGLGNDCAIKDGKPSVERGLYLRREALELALYTFNYVAKVDAVTVLMPPEMGKKPSVALLFRPEDVQPSLQNPLVDTLPGPTPSLKTLKTSPSTPIVNSITGPLQFDFSVTQDNTNARGYLVLDTPKGP